MHATPAPAPVADAGPDESPYPLTPEQVEAYRRDGFVQLDDLVTGDALASMREAVERAVAEEDRDRPTTGAGAGAGGIYAGIFNQKVNLWRRHPDVARHALQGRIGRVAAALEGRPVRMWHDQALFKGPNQDPGNPTPWHQDAPYWPHADRRHSLSVWIALRDATIENGCMTFVPGSQEAGELAPIDLDKGSRHRPNLLDLAPEHKGTKARTCPLRAGGATFHNGLTFHYAGANRSGEVREAFVVIYMPADVRYTGDPHVVTDPMRLTAGETFGDETFPVLG